MEKEKGFVTLATGKKEYYELAYNLLRSYRYRGGKYKFAILCDEENEYTREFDDVVILKYAGKCYLDKLKLLIDSPYEESIFIEPDCLCFENIDVLWRYFEGADDFSTFGWNDYTYSYFFKMKYAFEDFHIHTVSMFCPGYFYVKKSDVTRKMYADAMQVIEVMKGNPERYKEAFIGGVLRDDPVFIISMAMNNCRCAYKPYEVRCVNYPAIKRRKGHFPEMDFHAGTLESDFEGYNGRLCHFSCKYTKHGIYLCMVKTMNYYIEGKTLRGKLCESGISRFFFRTFFDIRYKITRRIKSK